MIQSDVAIIGAGFSATATLINLIEKLDPARSIAVVGAGESFGLGRAYATDEDCHRLNVPAARMSLYPDQQDHLVDWLSGRGEPYGPEDFIPRRLYGLYIRDTLARCLQHGDNRSRLLLLDSEAIDCDRFQADGQVYHLSDGQRLGAATSVLCLGGTPAGLPLAEGRISRAAREKITIHAWADRWIDRLDPDAEIVLIGTGLTMVDQLLSLAERGHRGRIHALSRHGLLPLAHSVPRAAPGAPALEPGAAPLSRMLKILRRQASTAPDWRMVVDGIRPVTQALWQALDPVERRRFFRHANAWWSIHRHRMAPQIAATIDAMRASGQLTVRAGWLSEVVSAEGRAVVRYRDRHAGTVVEIAADRLVNCTGMDQCSIAKMPLLKKMAARGLVASDAMGLGLAVSPASEMLSASGGIIPTTYAMGPMTMGQFFEIFAVPDIRVQAGKVSARIAAHYAATPFERVSRPC